MRVRYLSRVMMVSLLAALPAFANFKVASLQAEDFLLVFLLAFCIVKSLYMGFSFRLSHKLHGLITSYCLLLLSLTILAILSLRLPFYPLQEMSFLKQPVIFSISKLLQFTAIVCGFFWLANAFLEDEYYLDRAINIYWYIGLLSSWYSLASCLALSLAHLSSERLAPFLGAYLSGSIPRARGFFNEGGPFGMYLVSVFLLGLLRRHRTKQSLGAINVLVLSLAFLLSASRAGLLAAALLAAYSVMNAASFRKKLAYIVLSVMILCGAAIWLNLAATLNAYIYNYQNIEEAMALRGRDPNLVLGRIAASYIVPRMISAHPVSGIGFGNYPLMRNDPHYLGSLPAITDEEDLPALGFPGIAAETGIPAALWLMALLFAPYWMSRRNGIVTVAALYTPVAIAFGVQLTFAYPWFIGACALASSSWERPVRPHGSSYAQFAFPSGGKES